MNIHELVEPVLRQFRTRRMHAFARLFAITARTRILDLGGTPFNWKLLSVRPDVTLVNLPSGVENPEPGFRHIFADACQMPLGDRSYDIVFCNSVIEHVGDSNRQRMLAREVQRLAPSYYVETPNRYFPIEPHYVAPFIHYFPKTMQVRLLRHFTIWGWVMKPSPAEVRKVVNEIRLLSARDLANLFPDARIAHERLAGLSKSLIAIRQG